MTTHMAISIKHRISGFLSPRLAASPAGRGAFVILFLLPLFCRTTMAQTERNRPLVPKSHGLEDRPLIVESLGLQMNPPIGAISQVQRVGQQMSVSLIDGAAIPIWSMRIQNMVSTLPEPLPAAQVEQLLASWTTAGRSFDIVSNVPVVYGGRSGQLCYLRQSASSGQEIVTGWLILSTGSHDLLVFSLQILPDDLPRMRALLEASFSTIRLRDIEEIADERKIRLDAGRAFVDSLSPDQLRALIAPEQWYRYYKLDTSGAGGGETEVGYIRVEIRQGMRGELNPNRPEEHFDATERQTGLLVAVHGRIVQDAARNVYYDSEQLFWL